jgi:integrase/recombinase XerD
MTKGPAKEAYTPGFSSEIGAPVAKATEGVGDGVPVAPALKAVTLDEDSEDGLKLPEVLRYEEIDRFLLSLESTEDLIAARLMLFAGLRVSEACAVTSRDVDPESRSVFVRQGKFSKDRYAPLDIGTISLIRCHSMDNKLGPDEMLISSHVRTIQRHMNDAYLRAGITWGAGCHTLRHTCATWQLDHGIPLEAVRENLGHNDIKTTQIYLHLNIRQRSRTYQDATRFGI